MLGLGLEATPRVPTIADTIGDLCWLAVAVIGTISACSILVYGAAALWVLDPLNVVSW